MPMASPTLILVLSGLLGRCTSASIQVSGFRLRSKTDGSTSMLSRGEKKAFGSPHVSGYESNLHKLGEHETWTDLVNGAKEEYDGETQIADVAATEIEQDAQSEADFLEGITANLLGQQFELSFDSGPPSGSSIPSQSPSNHDARSPFPSMLPVHPSPETTVRPSVSQRPTLSVVPTLTPTETASPTQTAVPSASSIPSHAPTISEIPSQVLLPTRSPYPTNPTEPIDIVPTTSPAVPRSPTTSTPSILEPTSIPTASPMTNSPSTSSPTPKPTLSSDEIIFRCTPQGVELATPPFDPVTEIPIKVGYLVESLFFASEYLPALHDQILEASVVNALQCNDEEGNVFGPNGTIPSVPMLTTFPEESCTPQETMCTILQTDFQFWVEEQVNPEAAAFLSYVALQEEMNGGIMASEIPQLDRMLYLRPLPLLPPITDNEDDGPDQITANGEDVSVSPFTVGAVVTMSLGGLLALLAWARNRRTRNNRFLHLLENMSLESPDDDSGESS